MASFLRNIKISIQRNTLCVRKLAARREIVHILELFTKQYVSFSLL